MTTPSSDGKVFFHEIKRTPALKNRTLLKRFIVTFFETEGKLLDRLDVIFCSDKYLLKINQEYLHHDTYTDIITFDLSNQPGKIQGEIYISSERVSENSSIYQTSPSHETHRVIFHGILHLCGYRDKTGAEKANMRDKENLYLKKYGRFVSRETRST